MKIILLPLMTEKIDQKKRQHGKYPYIKIRTKTKLFILMEKESSSKKQNQIRECT